MKMALAKDLVKGTGEVNMKRKTKASKEFLGGKE